MNSEYVTASEASRILGVSRQRIANMIRDNDIECVRPWPRQVLIRRTDLDAWQAGDRPAPLHKTAVRNWIFEQEQVDGLDMLPRQDMGVLCRQFIDVHRPEWDETSKTNWVIGMVRLLSRSPA